MTLIGTLQGTDTAELLRAANSQKAYLYFDISVFNIGAAIRIKCTDQYNPPSYRTHNGYDFLIENDSTTQYYILDVLKDRLTDPEEKLTPAQITRIKRALKN